MSVKDKIAMWNSMSTGNNAPIIPPKATTSTFVPRPQHQEPPRTSVNANQTHTVETSPIVKPSELKKKAQMGQSAPINKTPEYVIKPTQTSYKPSEPIKKQISASTNNANQFSIDAPTVPKPSDIKKQLEQQISGNNFHLIAPVSFKKVESVTIQPRAEGETPAVYQVEKEVPRVSVKQSAEKLGLFYQKKNEEHIQQKEVIPEVHQQKHEKQAVIHQHQQTVPHEDTVSPKAQEHQFVLPQPQETPAPQPPQPEKKQQQQSQQSTQDIDLALRLKNRNKKKRVNFDSDED